MLIRLVLENPLLREIRRPRPRNVRFRNPDRLTKRLPLDRRLKVRLGMFYTARSFVNSSGKRMFKKYTMNITFFLKKKWAEKVAA